jgi:type IV pilus assembly protein PilP
MKARLFVAIAVTAWAFGLGVAGCGDDPPPPGPKPPPGAPPAGAVPPGTPQPNPQGPNAMGQDGGVGPSPTAGMPPLPLKEFQEKDFAETDQSRDPFRSYASVFLNQSKVNTAVQRKALVERYALDELKLLGIVTRAPARALLADPTGFGWVAKVGDFVGKPELVHAGGPTGIDVAINWRVDRIRSNDVVFVREDPSNPLIPSTTRVIALRTPEEEAGYNGMSRRP